MKDKTLNILLAVATFIIMGMIIIMHHQNNTIDQLKGIIEKTDTTTTVKHDTIYQTSTARDTVPKFVTRTVVKHDTLYKQNDTIPNILTLQSNLYENTLQTDSDTIAYQAYISGYDLNSQGYPKLDSINLSRTFKTITVYKETVIEKKTPQKVYKWHLSPSLGLGYGMMKKNVDVYLGLSLGYDIFGK